VLGVSWNAITDQFVFSFAEVAKHAENLESTKQNVTSLIGRIYNLLWFFAPFRIKFKFLMQALKEAKISWDETIPTLLLEQWNKLVAMFAED